jgi:hypothetical protein
LQKGQQDRNRIKFCDTHQDLERSLLADSWGLRETKKERDAPEICASLHNTAEDHSVRTKVRGAQTSAFD